MKTAGLSPRRRYQFTSGYGFAVETYDPVLAVYDTSNGSLGWYDFEQPNQPRYYIRIPAQELELLPYWEVNLYGPDSTPRTEYASDTNLIDLTVPSLSDPTVQFNLLTATDWHSVHVGSVVDDQIRFSSKCFVKSDRRIVGHDHDHSLLMAGEEYLISTSEQERTETSAKDHTNHLEFLMLSRDHSDPDLFRDVVHKLKRIGSRAWANTSRSWSKFWARFTRLGQLCPVFVATSSQLT